MYSNVRMINDEVKYKVRNISSMRRSVSSPDETPRRKLKIRRAAEYFDELRGVSSGDETLCQMLDRKPKMSSFSSDFQTLIKHYFLLYFLYELSMTLRNIDQVLATGNQV